MSKHGFIRLTALLGFLCLSLSVYSFNVTKRVNRLEPIIEAENQRFLNELCESVSSITVDLQKCLYAGTSDMLRQQGNLLCRKAAVAKENLSGLTDESSSTEEIYRFLSQVGNYTLSLCNEDTLRLSGSDIQNVQALYEYSLSLEKALTNILSDYSDGNVSFSEKISTLTLESTTLPEDFYTRMSDVNQTVTDYPTLLYDGPFSESTGIKSSSFLKNLNEITEFEAKEIAADFLKIKTSHLKTENPVETDTKLYCFTANNCYISVTAKGGHIYSFTDYSQRGEETISPSEAIKRGLSFLSQLGYINMSESYYSVYDGVCTVNYAYCENNVTCYNDLIKVGIALDSGEITALDTSGFIMNHKSRSFPEKIITVLQARRSLSERLKILSYKKALIPLDNKEVLCYEFHCSDNNGTEILVYIDAQTGEERNILILLYEDGGVLTK